jgi:chaperone modulatory protein CbpM
MNRNEFSTRLDVQVETLEFWLEQEWLVPEQTAADVTFSDIDVARGRLIRDLKNGFGVNDEGVDIILHLLDQLHGFRRAFEDIHEEIKEVGRQT